jgi:rare lipoprotein A
MVAFFSGALAMGVFGALPAAADFSDDVRKMGDPYRAAHAPVKKVQKQKVARATTIDNEREYDVRPSYRDDDDESPRAARPSKSKAARVRRDRQSSAHHVNRRAVHRASRGVRNMRGERRIRVAALPGGHQVHGVASYYYSGHTTASGARYNPDGLSAAHRSLPFGTRVRIKHLGNGRSVEVSINDRGPFIGGRVIDLSRGAAKVIGMIGSGLARVSVTILGR